MICLGIKKLWGLLVFISNKGTKNSKDIPLDESKNTNGLKRDLDLLTIQQKKAYNSSLKSFKGLTHYEAQRVLWLLGDAIGRNATLQ